MKLRDCKLITALIFFSTSIHAQHRVSGVVTFSKNHKPIARVNIYDKASGLLTNTDGSGRFAFQTPKADITLVFFSPQHEIKEVKISTEVKNLNVALQDLTTELSEVVINAHKRRAFELRRLKDVEETAIYAGKKTEVVLVEQSTANLASNNARQLYAQVSGLNIYQNDDAGLQLNIGGRGLDPNRTASFNTRQNGYDMSADVLGYPESYYTPAAEGLKEIQIIRGAASLQYGTQFGGLVNFKMKEPTLKPFEFITRNTMGSNGLYTNFTSVSGTKNKLSYYSFFNYKRGDGFRPNSQFKSKNAYAHIGYQFNHKTKLTGEVTYLHYLAKQGGGLNDSQFKSNPFQSNRTRNWFQVDWLLYNLKLSHKFSEATNFTINFFGLDASRVALGFRDRRVDLPDPGGVRDLISSDFNNYGFETRLLTKYKAFKKEAPLLVGVKFYKAANSYLQGPGAAGSGPDFSLAIDDFPFYRSQSEYNNPNVNVALFSENIFYMSDKLSITPGIRIEHIKTESGGLRKTFNFDGAGNPIDSGIESQDIENKRFFMLLGVGASYKASESIEFYGNISQNYRSVTFSDLNVVNPSSAVDPNIADEKGFTSDIGIRGNIKSLISFDSNVFGLFYNDRIGLIDAQIPPVNNVGKLRTNVGDARILGVESLIDFNLKNIFKMNNDFGVNYFINTAFVTSEYTASNFENTSTGFIAGNEVEFIPGINIKTGFQFGYKNLLSRVQYTYLSSQFTDATNALRDNLNSIVGKIPEYDILDISLSYKYKRFKLETGVNNILNKSYFTRRATGYPGPGIIPSAPSNFYATLQLKF